MASEASGASQAEMRPSTDLVTTLCRPANPRPAKTTQSISSRCNPAPPSCCSFLKDSPATFFTYASCCPSSSDSGTNHCCRAPEDVPATNQPPEGLHAIDDVAAPTSKTARQRSSLTDHSLAVPSLESVSRRPGRAAEEAT